MWILFLILFLLVTFYFIYTSYYSARCNSCEPFRRFTTTDEDY